MPCGAPPRAESEIMPELRLEQSLVDDRYEVRERLGLGSYAEIFVAYDRQSSGEEIVIKALNTSLQGTPDGELERTLIENLQNEAIALDTVRHPHVILRLGHGTAADLRGVPFHYLVLEYMSGGDLLHFCRKRPGYALKLPEALFYFRQVCEGLAYAHEQGIIHRDLKPNNFLLDADHQTLKVADFGVAKLSSGQETEITRVGAGIYAPPEHHPDEIGGSVGRLTAAADIYSLAKSFYTVVCGRAPNQFGRRPITSLPEQIAREPWADALLPVLRRATADKVGERYGSVIEFWSDLAGVAATAEDRQEIETRVRPRLRVAPGAIPESPELPSFTPVLASVNTVNFTSRAARTVTEAAPQPAKSPKIVVPIARPVAAPVLTSKPEALANIPSSPTAKSPAKAAKAEEAKARVIDWRTRIGSLFTTSLRRQLFIFLLGLAFLGLLAGTYNYARTRNQPVEIEVLTDNLTVRTSANFRAVELGWIPKGSRHRVLGTAENGWLRVEISQWNESRPHDRFERQGWVNGDEKFVNIKRRRLW
jgi:serine/threonine protein kinase